MDLGAIDERVPFDAGAADALIAACRTAASFVDGQAGHRWSLVHRASADFRGSFSRLFAQNALTASADATELGLRLREVADGAERLKEDACREQQRRDVARAW